MILDYAKTKKFFKKHLQKNEIAIRNEIKNWSNNKLLKEYEIADYDYGTYSLGMGLSSGVPTLPTLPIVAGRLLKAMVRRRVIKEELENRGYKFRYYPEMRTIEKSKKQKLKRVI
jgi:hypothetical protein